MSADLRVGVVGASGYAGGELLRLLHHHPRTDVVLATSDRWAKRAVTRNHPHLRGVTELRYAPHDAALDADLDVLFTAVPHGEAMTRMTAWLDAAGHVVDMSSDFRLRDPAAYPTWYDREHTAPHLLEEAVYGVPELHRDQMRGARLVSGPGCIATTAILALTPLAEAGLVEGPVVVDAKVGSSAAGHAPGPGTHHPERSRAVRPYAPTMHRHTAEVEQETGLPVDLTCTAVELVRGISAACHARVPDDVTERDLWRLHRERIRDEPFLDIVKRKRGGHRHPDPRVLTGTNRCDVGFHRDPRSDRVVLLAALDNLGKGAAGAAVQSMNAVQGWPETLGLELPALHPI